MKIRNYIGLMILMLIMSNIPLLAQSVSGKIDQDKVEEGQNFSVTYSIKGNTITDIYRPQFKGFKMVNYRQSGGGRFVSIINGKRTVSNPPPSYTFTLQSIKSGNFTIDPLRAKVDGKWVNSNKIAVKVHKQAKENIKTNGKDVFVKAIISNASPYLGEEVIITYKLYTSVQVMNYGMEKLPSYTGFWNEEIKNYKTKNQRRVNINGKQFISIDIQKTVVYPQQTGKITIKPADIVVIVNEPIKNSNSYNNPFFNNPFMANSPFGSQQVKKELKTNKLVVNVKALPSSGKTPDFNNVVGNFTMESELDMTEMKVNDAATLKITFKGKGSVRLIESPKINFPSDFEIYDPKEKNNITTSGSGASGSKSFEFLMIPRNPGDYSIPSYRFSYFNPKTKSYKTIETPEYKIKVSKGNGESTNQNTVTLVNQEDIKHLNKDIRFLKTGNLQLKQKDNFYIRSPFYIISLVLMLLISIAILIIFRKVAAQRKDIDNVRMRKANKQASKKLQKAKALMKENQDVAFYEEISQALWGYLADKFSIQNASLSIENVEEILTDYAIEPILIEQIKNTINDCEFARFAPSAMGNSNKETIYQASLDLITKIEKQ